MVALASAASHSRGRNLSLPLGDTQEVSQRLSGTCPSLMRARCSRWWRDSTLGAGGRRCQKPPRIRPRSARACEDGERQRPGGDLEGPHHSDGGHVPAELAAWVRARLRTCPRSTLLSPMRPRHTKMGGWVASSTSATQGQGLSDAAPFAPPPTAQPRLSARRPPCVEHEGCIVGGRPCFSLATRRRARHPYAHDVGDLPVRGQPSRRFMGAACAMYQAPMRKPQKGIKAPHTGLVWRIAVS